MGIATLKAVSQNLMHENLTIIDRVYGIPSESDVRKQIEELGHSFKLTERKGLGELVFLAKQILAR
ncbi:MAG TPA: hypothetical protein VIN60_08475 [Anaerolineales bacterium]